ncbi:hypothetical protein [Cupriavidus metallidurans]|uniref:hypothetical protein n=1 Tax=Cupriavidus metallidurans TaxID=119219 RepID=UPI003CFF5FE7
MIDLICAFSDWLPHTARVAPEKGGSSTSLCRVHLFVGGAMEVAVKKPGTNDSGTLVVQGIGSLYVERIDDDGQLQIRQVQSNGTSSIVRIPLALVNQFLGAIAIEMGDSL